MRLTKDKLKRLLKNAHLSPNKKNLYADCPKCGYHEFGISLGADHRFGCFRKKKCGFAGNIFTLLTFLDIPISQYKGDPEVNILAENTILLLDNAKVEEVFSEPETINPPLKFERLFADSYFESRGIQPHQFQKYKLGRSRLYDNYIIILIEMNGEIKGYIIRSEMPKSWHDSHKKIPRYKNATVDFGKLLGGSDELTEDTHTVLLVEGFFDKTAVEDHLSLDDDPGIKCCYTFGSHITDDQIRILKRAKIQNVILLFESDVLREVLKTSNEIGSKFPSVKVGYLPIDKDPNDMSREELLDVLEHLKDPTEFQLTHYNSLQ